MRRKYGTKKSLIIAALSDMAHNGRFSRRSLLTAIGDSPRCSPITKPVVRRTLRAASIIFLDTEENIVKTGTNDKVKN
jgi:hypothetical protein